MHTINIFKNRIENNYIMHYLWFSNKIHNGIIFHSFLEGYWNGFVNIYLLFLWQKILEKKYLHTYIMDFTGFNIFEFGLFYCLLKLFFKI